MEFLMNLERLMASYNMNRSEVARACGLSTSTVNSWWNRGCENVSLQTLLKLSASFNCSLEELVHGTPEYVFTYSENILKELNIMDLEKLKKGLDEFMKQKEKELTNKMKKRKEKREA